MYLLIRHEKNPESLKYSGNKIMGALLEVQDIFYHKKMHIFRYSIVSYTMNLNVTIPIISISFVSLCSVVA